MSSMSSNIERRMRRLAAASATPRVTERKMYQNDVGNLLVCALAGDLEPELGIKIPVSPVSAEDVIHNLDGAVDVQDPEWRNRYVRYKIPYPGIVFRGIVEAKNVAMEAANQILATGQFTASGTAFAVARAKVRAAQILVDWFHWKEGRHDAEMYLGAGYVAMQMVLDLCIEQAASQDRALSGIKVPDSAQLTNDQLVDGIGEVVTLHGLGCGALQYIYHVPAISSILNMVRDLLGIAEEAQAGRARKVNGDVDEDDSIEKFMRRWQETLERMPEAEVRLVVYVSSDLLNLLAEMRKDEKVSDTQKDGNGGDATNTTEQAEQHAVETPELSETLDPGEPGAKALEAVRAAEARANGKSKKRGKAATPVIE